VIDKPTIVYTDGSCIGNPGPGGWGVVIESPGGTQELSGGATSTTNNRMELMAAIRALEELQPGLPVQVVTDSRYVMNGITSWMDNWRRRNWRTANGKPVKNQDLWQRSTLGIVAISSDHAILERTLQTVTDEAERILDGNLAQCQIEFL